MGQIWIRSPAAPTCMHPGCGSGIVIMEQPHETATPRQAPHALRGDPVVWILAPISADMRLQTLQGNEPTFLLPLPRKAPRALPCVRTGGGPPVWRSWGWDLNPLPQTADPLARQPPHCLSCPPCLHMCHTHTRSHACTHTQVHPRRRAHTHRCTHKCTRGGTHTHRYTHGHARTEKCTHTGAHTERCVLTHTDAHRDAHTQRHTVILSPQAP